MVMSSHQRSLATTLILVWFYYSCKVVSAFLESKDPNVRNLSKSELQLLIDRGVLKVLDNDLPNKKG